MFAYVFVTFAAPPSPIMEAALGDGGAANVTKTYANMYQICVYRYLKKQLGAAGDHSGPESR